MDAERCVIVNADDFGRSNGTTLGVIAAHQHGIVTSASLMVRWPSARAAASYARTHPSLGVGLHVDLGDWVCRDGAWLRRHAPVDPSAPAAVEREVDAQLSRFRDLMGADPTHFDSHHRAHRHEPLRTILRERADTLQVPLRHETPDIRHCAGFYGHTRTGRRLAGAVSPETLVRVLAELGPEPTEVACHPALGGGGAYAATGREEVRALCDDRVRRAVAELRVALRTFREVPIAPPEGRAAMARGDARRAVRVFGQFARRHRDHVWPWVWLALARRAAGDPVGALDALGTALGVAPGSPAVAGHLVELLSTDVAAEQRRIRERLGAAAQRDPDAVRRFANCLEGLRTPAARQARALLEAAPVSGGRAAARAGGARGREAVAVSAGVARYLEIGDPVAAWRLAARSGAARVGAQLLARTGHELAARGWLSHSLRALTHAARLRPEDPDIAEAREAVRGEREVLSGRWALPAIAVRRAPAVPGRILHIVGSSLPDRPSGYAYRTHAIARAQRDSGLDAHVVTELGFPGGRRASMSFRVDEIEGVPYHRLAAGAEVPAGLDVRLTVHLAALAALVDRLRPSVLHAASDYRNALLARALGRALGVPVVYEVRGLWEETWRATAGRAAETSERYVALRSRERECAREADAVVTLGETLRDELVRRGVSSGRLQVIPNGVDPVAFAPRARDRALASRLGIRRGEMVVGCVSTLNRYEGLQHLVEAVALLVSRGRRMTALVVGDGPDRDRLTRLAADLGVLPHVRFTGRVPREQVTGYYSLLDAFVVPRTADVVSRLVTPLKPLEAMAAARPVVVSAVEALQELVTDGETGCVFRAGDSGALAAVLEALADDPALGARLGAAARRWVERERTWAHAGSRYLELYGALERARRPPRTRRGGHGRCA